MEVHKKKYIEEVNLIKKKLNDFTRTFFEGKITQFQLLCLSQAYAEHLVGTLNFIQSEIPEQKQNVVSFKEGIARILLDSRFEQRNEQPPGACL